MNQVDYEPAQHTAALLEGARRRLVETGTRNRLVHVNRTTKRSNTLTVINERADDIFGILKTDSRKMKFAATKSEEEDEPDELQFPPGHSDQEFDENRYTDQFLETPLTPDGLQKRLLKLARDARTAEEEQGVNILYLAIGFLRWFESRDSGIQRESPLVLLPVELVRNERTSTYDVRCRDDDIVTNLPLQERLRTDFGIELPELDDSEDWTPASYFRLVGEATSGHPTWTIDEDGMQLGFFSFSKLLMLRDLDPENWPEDALMHSDLVQKLLEDGFAHEPSLFDENSKLDEVLDPVDVLHVVDTDASQAKVIEEVRSERNLVVQGPPGTGKSQTITNILATAAYDGKTVLFVAEKMAALQVVYKRMVDIGLGDLCLELHSKSANKKAFLQELAKTLSNGRATPGTTSDHKPLTETRDALNRVVELLHATVPNHDYSPYEVISSTIGFIGRNVSPPRFANETLADLSKVDVGRIATDVDEFAQALAKVGNKTDHPFFGVENLELQPIDIQRLEAETGQAVEALRDLLSTSQDVLATIGLEQSTSFTSFRGVDELIALLRHAQNVPVSTSEFLKILIEQKGDHRFQEAVAAGATWLDVKSDLSRNFTDVAWEYHVGTIRANLAKGAGSFFSRLFGRYRSASSELSTILNRAVPKTPMERLTLVDRLLDGQSKLKAYRDDEDYLKNRLGEVWRGDRTDFTGLDASAAWFARALELAPDLDDQGVIQLLSQFKTEPALANELSRRLGTANKVTKKPVQRLAIALTDDGPEFEDYSLSLLIERLSRIGTEKHRYREWVRLHECRTRLFDDQVDELIHLLEDRDIDPDLAVDEFLYATAEARWGRSRSELPELNRLAGLDRHEMVESFKELDRSRITNAQTEIRSRHLAQLPQGASGEMGFLRGEIAKKRRHRSIRRAMSAAGSMVQRIKPVFMMSPISVAQFLPPGKLEFDLLVIDEASQVRPEEALGAVARAKQIVVVGDQKQLPPTSFFDRLADDAEGSDDEEDDDDVQSARVEEMESILSLCEARGLMPGMLEYHYRSRDPSLITVSNKEFYDDRLILPPSPFKSDDRFGLKFKRVPGVYSSRSRGGGRPGTNRLEAEAVVRELTDHAKTHPDYSIGVVTFSKAQADMMTEVLELARRQDSVLNEFLKEGQHEDVFVKNIENVQGDERDIILIGVGYGPHEPNGRLASMNFGPINSDGGERRLNVLFTRARIRCEVFASFDPGEIDLSRTKKNGPRVLKRFLEFAKSGNLNEKLVTGEDADSPFEEDVASVVASMGYEVDLQVGSAGFKIDLGVRHPERPGQYILAVECDGATYHSAIWARERDRQRQEILEGFGWRFHRIWSTDWFHNRAMEIERLRSALKTAVGNADQSGSIKGANLNRPTQPDSDQIQSSEQPIELETPTLSAPAYRRSSFAIQSSLEPHEVSVQQLASFVTLIVNDEGPIHTDEVARRLAGGFGKARKGSRIQSAIEQALQYAARSDQLMGAGGFWYTAHQEREVPIRDRSEETPPTTKPEYLSNMEIHAAAELIRNECGHIDTEELVRSISRLLGYKRAGQEFQSRVKSVLDIHGRQGRD